MDTHYDLMEDQPSYMVSTSIHIISLIASVLLMLILGCIRFIIRRDGAFWNDYNIAFSLLLFMACTYFVDTLVFLIHTVVSLPCPTLIFFKIWLSNQATMLSSAFAFSLVRRLKMTFIYCLIPFSFSLVLALTSFAFNQSSSHSCWFGNVNVVETLTLHMIPQGLCIVYNLGTVFYVLITKSSSLSVSYALYPLVPVVTQLGSIVAAVNSNGTLIWWASISNGLGGVIVFLVFFLDPLFWHGIRTLSRSVLSKTSNQNDDEETTLGNKRHTNLSDQSDDDDDGQRTIKSTSTTVAPPVMEKNPTTNTGLPRQYYQPSLSPSPQRDTPIIIFPPPPPTAASNPRHPTSLELEDADFVDMFAQPSPSLHVDTASFTTSAATLRSPPPICYAMEEAVPWRVLEAEEVEEDVDSPTAPSSSPPPLLPRSSSMTSNYRKESWLSLDDDIKDDDRLQQPLSSSSLSSSISSTSASPAAVSEWLTRRSDSLDGMREHMGRTSKSIRRWCRTVNKLDDDPDDLASRLHVVHEEQPQ